MLFLFSLERFEDVQKLISNGHGVTQSMLNDGLHTAADPYKAGKHKSVFCDQFNNNNNFCSSFFA